MNAGDPSSSRVQRNQVTAMIVIIVTVALMALYAGVQRLRRDKIEQAIVIPVASPTPSPVAR
ncbi:MAG: hypothetical protein ABR514_05090 [Chthoniobacterales bacterium]